MEYSLWIELADRLTTKLLSMATIEERLYVSDELKIFQAIEEVLREFEKERIVRIFIALPPPEIVSQMYERSRKRLLEQLNMGKSPQDLSRGNSTK